MKFKQGIFYGWFIVSISLVIMTVAYSVYFSWPVFYVAILRDFGWSRAGTAVIFSVGSIAYAFGSVVSGFLFDRFGPRKLFITAAIILIIGAVGCSRATEIWQLCLFFGFFIGFGTASCGFVPNVAMIARWFEKRRATAIGIAHMGTRDSFILAPVIQISILAFGWQNSYLLLASAVAVIIIPLSLFLRAKPEDMGFLPDGRTTAEEKADTKEGEADSLILNTKWLSTEWTLSKAIRTHQFFAFFLIMTGAGFTSGAFINHLVALVTDFGFSAMFAASLLLIYAITAVVGRCCAFVSDLISRERTFTLAMAMMLLPLPVLFMTKDASAPWMLYIFISGFGFGSGLYGPTYAASVADLFQGSRFGTIIGSANIGYGLGAAVGTWLYGYIFDTTGAYTLAVVIVGIALCIMCVSIWIASPRKARHSWPRS